jgi:hypothetical protein
MGEVLELHNYSFGNTYWQFSTSNTTGSVLGTDPGFYAGGRLEDIGGNYVGPYAPALGVGESDTAELYAHQISLVEYRVLRNYGNWVPKVGMLGIVRETSKGKYDDRSQYATIGYSPLNGHLSHLTSFRLLLKYVYDNNAELELRSFIF